MDKFDEVMQVTSLWNVLRTASAWISKAPDGVASVTSPMRNNAMEEVVDGDGMAEQAELAASHVLNATKDVLADLREQIVEASIELEGVSSKLAERKAELAATEKEVADAALRSEVASADAEFLAWQRLELEPQVDSLQRESESLRQKITESRKECEAAKAELRTQKEKVELVDKDLASKRTELTSLELAIDEAAQKKKTEQKAIEMVAEEKDKAEQGMRKLRRDYTSLSVDLLNIELDILAKENQLVEFKKPLHEFHRQWQSRAVREHGVLGKYARCKAECAQKEKEIKALEKELVSAEESNLALLLEKGNLEAALTKRTPEEKSENDKKLANYRTKIVDCCELMSELGNATDAFFIFLRVFGRQMHQTAVACLSEETGVELRNMLETMAAEATGFKEAVHGRKGPHTMGTAMAEASIGCKKQMELLRQEMQCLSEME